MMILFHLVFTNLSILWTLLDDLNNQFFVLKEPKLIDTLILCLPSYQLYFLHCTDLSNQQKGIVFISLWVISGLAICQTIGIENFESRHLVSIIPLIQKNNETSPNWNIPKLKIFSYFPPFVVRETHSRMINETIMMYIRFTSFIGRIETELQDISEELRKVSHI